MTEDSKNTSFAEMVMVVVGMAFYWPVFRNHYFGMIFNYLGTNGLDGKSVYLPMLALIAIFSLIVALFSRRFTPLIEKNRLCIPFISAIASLWTIGILFMPVPPAFQIALEVSGVVLFAAYVVLISIGWGILITNLSSDRIMFLLAVSFFVSFIISLTTQLPYPLNHSLPVVGPLVSGILWYLLPLQQGRFQAFNKAMFRTTLLRVACILVLFLLVGGIMRGLFSTGVLDYHPLAERYLRSSMSIAFSLALCIVLYFSSQRERLLNLLWVAFVLVFFAGLFITAAFTSALPTIGGEIVVMSRTFLGFFLWIVIINIARNYHSNPVFLFGIFFLITDCLSGILTNYTILPLAQNGVFNLQDYPGISALLMAFVLLLGSFGFLSTLAFKAEATLTVVTSALPEEDKRKLACEQIAQGKGLTARETDVLYHISQGHSIKKVAETLFISVATAQTHTKSLYRKIGLHSRQAVIDSIEEEIRNQGSSEKHFS